jgi:WD40 repeat protein
LCTFKVNQPSRSLRAHGDKVSIVKFSPTAVDVVATAAFDWTVKIWSLDTAEVSLSRSPS